MEKLQSCRVFHISKRLQIDELNNEHYKLEILNYTGIHCVEQMFSKAWKALDPSVTIWFSEHKITQMNAMQISSLHDTLKMIQT